MFTNKDIIDITIENKKYSAIAFSNKNTELPSFLLQGEKKPGYLYKDDNLEPWYWEGFTTYNEKKCLYFDPIKIFPLSELAFSLRSKAPQLIINLSKALSKLDNNFLDLQGGIISAWRVYFGENNEVLILPRSLSDIFSSTQDEMTRYNNANYFIHAGILSSFTLIDQMAQLFYYSMTGIRPFEYKCVRENNYNAINLNILIDSLNIDVDNDLVSKIDKILHLKLNKVRDISSNFEPQIALKWFIERFENISWDLENREYFKIGIDDLLNNEKIEPTISKYLKKEKLIVFWRKKGTLIIISTLIAVLVIGFVSSRIKVALEPPYTQEYDQNGIINAYYQAQNDLDVQKLEASLKRGVKSPISNEITTLFVTRQTRMAYERVNSIVNLTKWVNDKMPPIENGKIIYGIDDVTISQINENQYLAKSIFYSPYPLDSEIEEDNTQSNEEEGFYCYRFEQSEIFSFEYNDRGWYEISNIQPTNMKYIDTLVVPTYDNMDLSYEKEKDTRQTEIIIENKYINKNYN